jgi:hypothetical protein
MNLFRRLVELPVKVNDSPAGTVISANRNHLDSLSIEERLAHG